MNTNIKFFLFCPLPEEQKPINQYIGLKENFLTSWTTLSTKNYQKKIFYVSTILFFFICFLELPFLENSYYLLDWLLQNLFFTINCILGLFLIIISRWIQIDQSFAQARVFYEESSWYDGQIWEKPFSIIKNDQLIRSQKIRPIRKRIQTNLFQLFGLNLVVFFFLQI